MKTVFADPKTDVIFKKLFGQKAHQHLLVELLNPNNLRVNTLHP